MSKIPLFPNLSAILASLLGVILGSANYSEDLNNVTSKSTKIQTCGFNSDTQNIPPISGGSDTKLGVAIYIPCQTGNNAMGLQFAVKYNCSEVFLRTYWVDRFQGWKQVTLI